MSDETRSLSQELQRFEFPVSQMKRDPPLARCLTQKMYGHRSHHKAIS